MAFFRKGPKETERLDWRLLQHGSIALYHRSAILAEDATWFQREGYIVYTLDASTWSTPRDFHEAAKRALRFPSHYANNLAAWIDCLGDLQVPDTGGVVLQLTRYDAFARAQGHLAQTVLDSIESASRRFMLVGRRLIALVQSDDPRLRFERVGAAAVTWNPREWLESDRRPRPVVSAAAGPLEIEG